jgi:hypothetical protein
MTKTKLAATLIIALLSAGCATSPVAWKDLGDGQGMRGWAGIPLKDTMPLAAAQQQNAQLRQIAQSTRRMEQAAQLQALQPYITPPQRVYVQPMHIPAPAPWVPIPTGL